MDVERFFQMVREGSARRDQLMRFKGADYTRRDPDKLANFKRVASQVGVTPEVCWGVYFLKHIDAILTYVQHGEVESEDITSRIDDAINYLMLLEALVREKWEMRDVYVSE